MTIQVISNTPAEQSAEALKTETTSEPEAKTSEQKSVAESDPAETEKEETKDDAEESESDEDEDKSDDSEKDKPKKKSGSQRRKERAERAEAKVEELQQRLARLERAGESNPEKTEAKSAAADDEPNPDDFDTHVAFVKALTKWEIAQGKKAEKADEQKAKLLTEHEQMRKSHSERVKSFAAKTGDFNDVISDVDDVPMSVTVQELIVSSENGPALMYELAKNRAEFERINKLPPLAAARELGKIESKLSVQEKKPEPKKITKAPNPLDPVGKGSSGSVVKSIDDPNLSQAEYERLRREQMRQKQA